MKIIKNNICYVEKADLLLEPIPHFEEENEKKYDEGEFVSFTSEEAILYFQGRTDILDYEKIANLSKEELETEIKTTYEKMQEMELHCLDSEIEEENMDPEYKKLINKLKRIYVSLRTYKSCKATIDIRMKEFLNDEETSKLTKKI